jgi:uncharacterized protein (DUF1501 family)
MSASRFSAELHREFDSHSLRGRRHFLTRSAAMMTGACAPFALGLHGIAAAADAGGYKALVCVFLNGGNDHANTVIPYTTAEYQAYLGAREAGAGAAPKLARVREDLLPLAGGSLALPKEMPQLQKLYADKKLAILANVGVLTAPTSRAEYDRGAKPLPPALFSHSDQANFWQYGLPAYSQRSGWGGRLADVLAAAGVRGKMSMNVSLAGSNIFQTGETVIPYSLGRTAPLALDGGADGGAREGSAAAVNAMLSVPQTSPFTQEIAQTYKRAIETRAALVELLAGANDLDKHFPNAADGARPSLSAQLLMAAKMIKARKGLGLSRQVFYVSRGGFDTHDSLGSSHPALLAELDTALASFYAALKSMGVENDVVTFTASDFGRMGKTNGRGSDHGWGGHHFILGGAVKGGSIFGSFPDPKLGGELDVGQGRLLPTTSVDQYSATLARWMGVSASEMPTVLPNIGRFAPRELGFV